MERKRIQSVRSGIKMDDDIILVQISLHLYQRFLSFLKTLKVKSLFVKINSKFW